MTDAKAVGMVYLVGAGPGDPGLITVKGLELLRQADVVLYDRLAPAELLHETRPNAELIDAGKFPRKEGIRQDEINRLLVAKAKAGRLVVRLKGGDPFVFGRGGEEALACHEAGIPFAIVPGVTSAVAVPAYAGVPVTHRDLSSAFAVFTGYEDPDKDITSVDYEALASVARTGTLVVLMSVSRLTQISERLISAGLDPDTPALCIEAGTMPGQRVVTGTVRTLPQSAAEANLKPPAITVIGAVVKLRHAGLRWFSDEEAWPSLTSGVE